MIEMGYALVKTLHIIFMVTWFAGLFYLPRLFVYHALAPGDDRIGIERFKTMERKLYYGIMAPGAILTVVFGSWMWLGYGVDGRWLHAKVTFVAAADRVSRLPRLPAAGLRARPEPPWPRLLPLAQRNSGAAVAPDHRLARRRQAVLKRPRARFDIVAVQTRRASA